MPSNSAIVFRLCAISNACTTRGYDRLLFPHHVELRAPVDDCATVEAWLKTTPWGWRVIGKDDATLRVNIWLRE